MGGAFGEHRELQRGVREVKLIERAVLGVGLEQPVEPEQAGEQRRNPQHRRADAGEQIGIGSDREGRDRHQREKEDHAHRARAAEPLGDADFPQIDGEEGGCHDAATLGVFPSRNSRVSSKPSGSCVAATIMPPSAQ